MTKVLEKQKVPTVTNFLDAEEEILYKMTESEEFIPSNSDLTPELIEFYRQCALNSLPPKRAKSA